MSVRVRVAPSPTGDPHIGTARLALWDWLLARRHGGAFIVRIEDTDRERLVPGAVESVMRMLHWLGIDPDEGPGVGGHFGPYVQSERLDLYAAAAEQLIANEQAYRCWCTRERLALVNEEKQKRGEPPGYDRHCRNLSLDERAQLLASGQPFVVRLAVPLEGVTAVVDALRDEPVLFENATLQDAVLIKSDGYPTYHLAMVVDDHHMQITHVLRGNEWIASAPLHVILFEAFGWDVPVLAHMPLILGADKKKLSKRNGDVAFSAFIEHGYLPDALFNFLGLLGWSLDDKSEIISRQTFIEHFDLERVNRAGAIFDQQKLDWMNSEYIKALPDDEYAAHVGAWLRDGLPAELTPLVTEQFARQAADLLKTRIKRFDEVVPQSRYLLGDVPEYHRATLLGKKFASSPDEALFTLEELARDLEELEEWDHDAIWETMQHRAAARGLKNGEIAALVRVAIAGSPISLPLTESMEIIGKHETLRRLKLAVQLVQP
jgi:glutamyl-tRNA synthetase